MKRFIAVISLILALSMIFASCGSKTENETVPAEDYFTEPVSPAVDRPAPDYQIPEDDTVAHPVVKFTMKNGGEFSVKLYPEYAPETVENFVSLVSSGFYDGLTFHRVCEGFMAQGGDPEGTGNGGSEKEIKGEFAINNFPENLISHKRGVISMARRGNSYDSASSQFFICFDDSEFLDGQYAAFGIVTQGMSVVDHFLDIERKMGSDGALSSPVTPIIIDHAEVVS